MTFKNGHVEFAGWVIHIQAAVKPDPYGYDAPAARYNFSDVVYGGATAEANWQTIDCQVLRVSCGHGGRLDQIPGVRASLGRLTANLYDPDRELDPAASPFTLLTRVGVPVRVVAVEPGTGTEYPLWTGRAETWSHDLLTGEGQLVASDNVALIAGVDVANWERPAENAKSRLAAVVAYLPEPMTLVFTGVATSLSASKFSGTLWQAVANTSEAEQSITWVDQWGRLRRSDITGFGTAIQARDCDDGSSPLIYTELTSVTDDEVMTNVAIVDRLNLPENLKEREPLQFQDTTSAAKHGPHSLTETNLPLLDDAALGSWAQRVLDLRAYALSAVSGMSVLITDAFPWVDRTVPAIVAMQVGQVLDIRLTSRGKPAQWTSAIAGIQHTITRDEWVVDLEVADGAKIALNRGYDDPSSIYDVTKYSGSVGVAPAIADIVRRILAAEEASYVNV